MGLIKSDNAPSSVVRLSISDVSAEADALLARAARQAEELLADARTQAHEIREAARAKGFEQGRQDGLAAGIDEGLETGRAEAIERHSAELTSVLDAFKQAALETDRCRRNFESAVIGDVVQLSVAVAARVTKRQGLIEPAVLCDNLAEALKLVVSWSDLRILVNPTQKQTLLDAIPRLRIAWPAMQHVEIIEDAQISPGGCRVFTKGGRIDADLESQLDRVVADLLPSRGDAPS